MRQLISLLLASGWLAAQQPARLNLVGDASHHQQRIRLTPAENDQKGAAWHPEKMHVANGFDVSFDFQLTEFGGLGPGADGLAFVIQNDGPRALAGIGSSGELTRRFGRTISMSQFLLPCSCGQKPALRHLMSRNFSAPR